MKVKKFTEKSLVEDYITEKLQEKGWKYVNAEDLGRESFEEPLLVNNLIDALKRINRGKGLGGEEIKNALNELKLRTAGSEDAKKILNFYKFGVLIKFEKEKVLKHVQLFDFDELENNEFIVSRQVSYDGKERIRTDIILYVNGIPLVSIECKNPTSIGQSWYNAYKQIKDYEETVPELYKYVQIGVAAERVAKYFPIVPWQKEGVKIHQWKSGKKDSIDATVEMLSPEVLLDIIRNFLFCRVESGNETKVITRYMQYRAANKMVNRVLRNIKGEEEKKGGLIWHWQGSGKTLTMIFAAHKLYYTRELENPTIFFIVDRLELEDQFYTEFFSLDIMDAEVIGSIRDLKKFLRYDNYRGKRGVFIVLVHKFRPDDLKELQREIENKSERQETIMNRENVVCFIDEGHRTQYGLLAAQMNKILKNAFKFALTGTPISKRDRDTYREFSYPPEEPYLDRYFITESIEDGFTVKIAYQPRLENEVHLEKDMLRKFLEVEIEEIPEEVRDEVERKVRRRLNPIVMFLENESRIEKVAEDISKHFMENVDGRFKAMVVAASRKACIKYKKALDKYLPKEYSEVVMTYGREDSWDILNYLKKLKERFKGKDVKEIKDDIVQKFKEDDLPKILIVTDMLLTGFDAPILQTMYLDKPLKEHRLLQAVARVNRLYKGLKEYGMVVDYVGVLKEFHKALEMYSKKDIRGSLYSLEYIREEFNLLMDEIMAMFEGIDKKDDRKTLLKAIEIITLDEDREKEFVEKYGKLRRIFEILGSDETKLDKLDEYRWISAVYVYYMKTVLKRPSYEAYVKKYFEKSLRFIYKTTKIEKLDKELPVIEFDDNYLRNLEKKVESKEEKAVNILFTLNRVVLVHKHRNPIYRSLIEKVEELLELWREKTKDYERIYRDGVEILKEMDKLTKRQKELNFSNTEYSLLLTLEEKFGEKDELIEDVKELSDMLKEEMFPGWINQTTARKKVERKIRRFLRQYVKRFGINLDELDELYEKMIDDVKNYEM